MVVTAGTVYVQMPARRRPGIDRFCHRCGLPFHASLFGWEVLGWLFLVDLYVVIQAPHSPFVGFHLRCRCSVGLEHQIYEIEIYRLDSYNVDLMSSKYFSDDLDGKKSCL